MASFFCAGVQGRGAAHMLSLGLGATPAFGGAGADKIALNIGQPAEHRQHQAPCAAGAVGPRFRQGSELRLASAMRLTMANRSKALRASRSMRVTVTTSPGASLPSIRFRFGAPRVQCTP